MDDMTHVFNGRLAYRTVDGLWRSVPIEDIRTLQQERWTCPRCGPVEYTHINLRSGKVLRCPEPFATVANLVYGTSPNGYGLPGILRRDGDE